MAIHVPLPEEAQAEARILMLAAEHILNPKDGKPVVTHLRTWFWVTTADHGRSWS